MLVFKYLINYKHGAKIIAVLFVSSPPRPERCEYDSHWKRAVDNVIILKYSIWCDDTIWNDLVSLYNDIIFIIVHLHYKLNKVCCKSIMGDHEIIQ